MKMLLWCRPNPDLRIAAEIDGVTNAWFRCCGAGPVRFLGHRFKWMESQMLEILVLLQVLCVFRVTNVAAGCTYVHAFVLHAYKAESEGMVVRCVIF